MTSLEELSKLAVSLDGNDTVENPSWKYPHAFHLNLPPNHKDEDGIPYITKYAHKKSRYILKLVETMVLTEAMFVNEEGDDVAADIESNNLIDEDGDTRIADDDAEFEKVDEAVDEGVQMGAKPKNLSELLRLCSRLQSQMSSLESLKHSGLSRVELAFIVLHILKLVTATYSIEVTDGSQQSQKRSATLFFENVGYIHSSSDDQSEENQFSLIEEDSESLESALQRRFALPSPGRKILLSLLVNILSNKGPLRSVSNAAVFATDDKEDLQSQSQQRFLLIIHWRVLLRMLLRTAPYLDEYKVGYHPMASNLRENRVVRQTVQMIRDARHFFDQGLCPKDTEKQVCDDKSAREIWDMVKTDVLFHSHTNACYRSLIILYLFHPSRSTSQYYAEMMPIWFDAWTNIDRCPEIDFLWLALFARARKHLPTTFDWGPIRRRLLTNSQYWLQVPIGGGSLDKSFPNAANPRSRSCPTRLKVFAGASSSYEEGIDFVAKVAKLLVIGLGSGTSINGVSEGTKDVLRFLNFVTPYFNPSNLGSWTFTLGAFLHYFSYEVSCRMGVAGSMNSIRENRPQLAKALCEVEPSLSVADIPPHEVVLLMDSLLPLCQQSLYSKNSHVGRAGEAAMVYLAQIDPFRVTPVFIDFAMRALGVSAVNLAHQAPAALSALTRLLQPSLRRDPNILLVRLPDILRLTLAGIDSNDQNKTIRTLILYRSLTSWIPVGGAPKDWKYFNEDKSDERGCKSDGTMVTGNDLHGHLYKPTQSPTYIESIEKLPDSSLLRQGSLREDLDFDLLVHEASSALSDWVLEFLDRIYDTLRATGEREKVGNTASGVASRHSSADVQVARNFSRVLKECLMQTFSAMDDEVHKLAVNSVKRFLSEETLPNAAKDTSYLCLAACSARVKGDHVVSPGMDALVPILMDELEHHSNKTVVYRLRCLSGAVRSCGVAIIKHKDSIKKAIDFALRSKDKHVYKTGCKLLRHTLSTLCESYSLASGFVPRIDKDGDMLIFGKSAQLHSDPIKWHVPNGDCIQFAWELFDENVMERIKNLPLENGKNEDSTIDSAQTIDIYELRRCLRVVRYALRGGAGIVLDFNAADCGIDSEKMNVDASDESSDVDLFPYERAVINLLKSAPKTTFESMMTMRSRISSFAIALINLIASESFKINEVSQAMDTSEGVNSSSEKKFLGSISSDPKVCKEVSDISLLLLTRRGAAFRSQESKNIWKAHKQLTTDFAILAEADHTAESLQRAQMYGSSRIVFFKDGEDSGKTLPRRLLVARIQLFHDSLQRNASFEVPKRLRRLSMLQKRSKNIMFSSKIDVNDLCESMKNIKTAELPLALDAYEGVFDGLFSLTCHSNTQVRASAIGVVDYAITRFGWLLKARLPRLLSAIKLRDDNMHGKFGLPSCSMLRNEVDSQGRRKRLSEAMKGVCSMLAIPRASKEILSNEKFRNEFIKTICGNEDLVSLMPAEEMQKMVHYLHSIFSPFRLGFYSLPRSSTSEKKFHENSLIYLLDILSTDKTMANAEEGDEKDAHWRKLLLACWFLTVMVDEYDLAAKDKVVATRLWKLCFQILEDEYGQPLQRVALGLFGRLVMMITDGPAFELLRKEFLKESFCLIFGKALVYDHKEDTSVGGGHGAQWATGVADMIRDSARNIAPKSLFPFQRTNQSSGTFKVSHAQLVQKILIGIGGTDAITVSKYLLSFSKEMAASPPSEDQRNQQCTSAEIFAGVTRAFLQMMDGDALTNIWNTELIPFLVESIPKFPISLSGAYFDSIRFAIQFSPPNKFFPLTQWLFGKIEETLWEPRNEQKETESKESEDNVTNIPSQGTEGFTAQSKWLYLCAALLVELDETEIDSTILRTRWYTKGLAKSPVLMDTDTVSTESLKQSWKLVSERLLPRLIEALGHPYESCRDHISGCLFRICYCHRKMSIGTTSKGPSRSNSAIDLASLDKNDPGSVIVQKLLSLQINTDESFQNRYNSLITARRFFSYCVHYGEAKFEYSDYIIPLLPLAFESLNSTVEDGSENPESDTVSKRALEAEVVKGYRRTIAEVSISSVISYSGDKGESDISRVLDTVETSSKHDTWQVRHASANFLRCFQGSHKFLFSEAQAERITSIAVSLLGDERREVSSAAMAAVTGIIAAMPSETISILVSKYISEANRSKMKKVKKSESCSEAEETEKKIKEQKRAKKQQSSVFFLCATILSQPYETPPYVPKALAAISKHSFKRNAPLGIRDTVKKCCAEYKKTHMSDNWEVHRSAFTQEELEALEDVVSSPHYYA